MKIHDIVVTTEGGDEPGDVLRTLRDLNDGLTQPGVGAVSAGGVISGLRSPIDESEQHTPIIRVSEDG